MRRYIEWRCLGLVGLFSILCFSAPADTGELDEVQYQQTLDAVSSARQANKTPREISDIYLWGSREVS